MFNIISSVNLRTCTSPYITQLLSVFVEQALFSTVTPGWARSSKRETWGSKWNRFTQAVKALPSTRENDQMDLTLSWSIK